MDKNAVISAIDKNLAGTIEILSQLIAFPSTRGNEQKISRFLKGRMENLVDRAELVPLPDTLIDDPDYSFRLEDFAYKGTANLRVIVKGSLGGKSLAFNTHLDVVPPTVGQESAFSPIVNEGKVYGRGACDAKGQVAVLWLVLKTIADLGLRPGGDLTVDFVAEEECGGNGSLLVVRQGLRADAAVVLEPVELQVAHLVRGAVWFEVNTRGVAGHSGSPGSTVSALKEAIKSIESIEKVREELLAVARGHLPMISGHPNPMPVTFGMLHSGNWPAAAPSEAVLKGVFGFLPPFHRHDIQERLRQAVSPDRAEIRFNMLNSDPAYIPADHPLVGALISAAQEAGIQAAPAFMNASCDSWRYTEQLGIPAVVFGPGSITKAHAVDEHIAIFDIRRAALALIYFVEQWSGLS
jgi:acetylornithine deacetylase